MKDLTLRYGTNPNQSPARVYMLDGSDLPITVLVENLTLASRVSAKLAVDRRTSGVDVKVAADDGIVTITGETRLREESEAIQAVARQVKGVKEVRSQVVFTPTSPAT